MQREALAGLAAALALASASASASDFTLEVRGSGEYYEWGQPPQPNGDPEYPAAWVGFINITTSSTADGTYTGASLKSIDLKSVYYGPNGYLVNPIEFAYKAGDPQYTDPENWATYGMEPGASVTLLGGQVVGVDFHWDWEAGDGIDVVGFNASASGYPWYGHHSGDINLTGVATPVPELPISTLLLGGLAVLLTGTRAGAGRPSRRSQPRDC